MPVISVSTVIAGIAAVFAYLSWVKMTTMDLSDIQDEMHTRICDQRRPSDHDAVIYPTTTIVSEHTGKIYRILKYIIPFYKAQGGTRVEIDVIRPDEVNIYRMRKSAFGENSSYSGVRASNYDSPEQIILNYDSIDPNKVQHDFRESIRLLRGDYKIVVDRDTDLKSIWDSTEQAPGRQH